jgi:CBS-domain-containing membrane protein
LSIAIMSVAAVLTRQPLIFPSLGPTAFLLFYKPGAKTASPRATLGGHLIGMVAGYVALVVFGLTSAGPALSTSVTWPRVGAAALSLGLTSAAMIWLGLEHPPAGATTLIVSLGILTRPVQLAVLMLAVVLLVLQALLILHLAGIDYPAEHEDRH